MGNNLYSKVYEEIVASIEQKGLKFKHRKRMSKLALAYYDVDNGNIAIREELAKTKMGCLCLSHELNHFTDHSLGLFPEFYNNEFYSGSRIEAVEIILCAEFSAYQLPKKIFSKNGFRIDNVPQFSKKWLRDNYSETWIEYFNL